MDSANEKSMGLSELSKLAEGRAGVYQLLSFIYIKPPDQDILKGLLDLGPLQISTTSKIGDQLPEQMLKGLKTIRDFLEKHSTDSQDVNATNLQVEFTKLFRGLKRGEFARPPYESIYLGEEIVFGESTVEIYLKYYEFGLSLASQYRGEPPDYISFELDFMRFLCNKESEAWREDNQDKALTYLKAERSFLDAHLLKWMGEFCEEIRTYEKLGFYGGWADVTEGWIKFDHQNIADLIEDMSHGEEN